MSCEKIEPGESAYVQLRLEEPAAFCPGDRFIVRFYSPLETIGGGIILEMGEKKERKYHDGVLQRLELLENNLWNQENKCSKEIPDREKSLQEQISLEKRIMDELESWLSAHPYRRGMPKTVLFNQISKGKKEQNREIQKCLILLEEHGNVGCIRLQQENSSIELISPEGYKVKETEEVSKLRKTKKKSGIQSQDELMEILNYMQEENEITEVCESVYTTTEITFKIRTEVSRMLSVSKVITLSQVKEVFQTSRKNARLIFEYTDRIGFTAKEGAQTERSAGNKLQREQIRGK